MIKKNVFLTLGLSLTMGLAAVASISMAKESQPANAATVTIYAKMEHSWWTADGAAIGIYCWGSGDPKVAWPGERMTSVDSSQGLWNFDIDIATYPNVIFISSFSEKSHKQHFLFHSSHEKKVRMK